MAQTTSANDVEQLMNDYLALRSGGESKLETISESFVFHSPVGEYEGRDALIDLQAEIETVMSDGELTVEEIVYGDDVAMWEWTLTGTHDGEWEGVPASGNAVTIRGMSKTSIRDGQVQENWAYFDAADFFDQIGATA